MKFYLISDNSDTYMGMRIAGVEGTVVHTEQEVGAALDKALEDEEIGVVLITIKLAQLCEKRVDEIKLSCRRPLIVEIPDRHGGTGMSPSLSRAVEEAVGVTL